MWNRLQLLSMLALVPLSSCQFPHGGDRLMDRRVRKRAHPRKGEGQPTANSQLVQQVKELMQRRQRPGSDPDPALHRMLGRVPEYLRGLGQTTRGDGPPAICANAHSALTSVAQSGGFFCEDEESWQLRRTIARRQDALQDSSNAPDTRTFFMHNYEPAFSCVFERRVGQPGDGGKWVCDPHKLQSQTDCLVYSFGSDNKFDFEEAVTYQIGPHCEIHTFDHTIGANPSNKPANVHFHPWGLGADYPPDGVWRQRTRARRWSMYPLIPLTEIVEMLNHTSRRITILKMDIEGGEFDALPWLLDNGYFDSLGVHQVLIEVHKRRPIAIHTLMQAFRKAGYAIFHKEPNIQWSTNRDVAVEYALVKLDKTFWE